MFLDQLFIHYWLCSPALQRVWWVNVFWNTQSHTHTHAHVIKQSTPRIRAASTRFTPRGDARESVVTIGRCAILNWCQVLEMSSAADYCAWKEGEQAYLAACETVCRWRPLRDGETNRMWLNKVRGKWKQRQIKMRRRGKRRWKMESAACGNWIPLVVSAPNKMHQSIRHDSKRIPDLRLNPGFILIGDIIKDFVILHTLIGQTLYQHWAPLFYISTPGRISRKC